MACLKEYAIDPAHAAKTPRPQAKVAAATRHSEHWTQDTALLQVNHPRVRLLALRLTQLLGSETERILACFDHVKRMPFIWTSSPYDTTSFDVIGKGCGDAHTKSTLFVALLRCIGIPARVRVVTVDPRHRTDDLPGRPARLEHVVTQVHRQGHGWVSVDSYTMDPALSVRSLLHHARAKGIARHDIHLQGSNWWNGLDDSLMFVDRTTNECPVLIDHGCFHDVQQYHARAGMQDARGSGLLATFIANRRLRRFRAVTPDRAVPEKCARH